MAHPLSNFPYKFQPITSPKRPKEKRIYYLPGLPWLPWQELQVFAKDFGSDSDVMEEVAKWLNQHPEQGYAPYIGREGDTLLFEWIEGPTLTEIMRGCNRAWSAHSSSLDDMSATEYFGEELYSKLLEAHESREMDALDGVVSAIPYPYGQKTEDMLLGLLDIFNIQPTAEYKQQIKDARDHFQTLEDLATERMTDRYSDNFVINITKFLELLQASNQFNENEMEHIKILCDYRLKGVTSYMMVFQNIMLAVVPPQTKVEKSKLDALVDAISDASVYIDIDSLKYKVVPGTDRQHIRAKNARWTGKFYGCEDPIHMEDYEIKRDVFLHLKWAYEMLRGPFRNAYSEILTMEQQNPGIINLTEQVNSRQASLNNLTIQELTLVNKVSQLQCDMTSYQDDAERSFAHAVNLARKTNTTYIIGILKQIGKSNIGFGWIPPKLSPAHKIYLLMNPGFTDLWSNHVGCHLGYDPNEIQ